MQKLWCVNWIINQLEKHAKVSTTSLLRRIPGEECQAQKRHIYGYCCLEKNGPESFSTFISICINGKTWCNLSSFKVQLVPKYTHQHQNCVGVNDGEKFGSTKYWHFHHPTQSFALMALILNGKVFFLFYSFLCNSKHTSFAWNFHFPFLCLFSTRKKVSKH